MRRAAAAVVIAWTVGTIPAGSEGYIGELTTNVTLVSSLVQKGCHCEALLPVPVLADPASRDFMHRHTL